jgi:hypothetical protein
MVRRARSLSEALVHPWLLAGLGLASSGCADGLSDSESRRCGAVQAYRVTPDACPAADESLLQWCKEDGEDHWGIGAYCMSSPEGELYVVLQTFGTELVNSDGWSRVSTDAGVDLEQCETALRWHDDCGY